MLYDVISKCIACSQLQRCGMKLLETYHTVTYIHQSRKKSTTGPSSKKSRTKHYINLYMFLWIGFPSENALGKRRSQKIAYTCIFVLSGIFPLILAYAILNKHHNIAGLYIIAQLTHIRTYHFIFLVPTVTSLAMLLDVFPKNALGDGPKNHGYGLKSLTY